MFKIIKESELSKIDGYDVDAALQMELLSGAMWTKINDKVYAMTGLCKINGIELDDIYAIITSNPNKLVDDEINKKYVIVGGKPMTKTEYTKAKDKCYKKISRLMNIYRDKDDVMLQDIIKEVDNFLLSKSTNGFVIPKVIETCELEG